MKYTHVLSNEMQVTRIIRRPGICASDKRWITGGITVVFITDGIPGLLVINILQSLPTSTGVSQIKTQYFRISYILSVG